MKGVEKLKKKLIVAGLIVGMIGLTGCAELERNQKDMISNISGGLNRKVDVYSHTGDIIKEYEGKIDLAQTEDATVKFELNGKRIMVKNAVVIIEEK